MRIAFGHYSSVNDISGVSSWLVELALYLKRHGCSIAIHVLDLGRAGEKSDLELALTPAGIEIFRSPATGNLRMDLQESLTFLNNWRPDVFLPQCKTHHYVAAAVAGRCGLAWALTLHSDDPDYWAIAKSLTPERHGGRTVCVSQHILSKLIRNGGDADAMVIPYGVSIPDSFARFQDHPFHVVYSGRLWEHQKRASLVVETLIKACEQGGGRICATLIGDGYSRAACEQQVREAKLEGLIQFSGRLPAAGVKDILLNSQAILLMSDFEGLPVALLEAMAAGVVPVVRAIPSGVPEVVRPGETGLLVSDNPEEAAAALLYLAENPVLWERCSSAARQLVSERFSSEQCHRNWLELLRQMQSNSSPAYPIRRLHGVRLGALSPLMLEPYKKPSPWQRLRMRQRLSTILAKMKRIVKKCCERGGH